MSGLWGLFMGQVGAMLGTQEPPATQARARNDIELQENVITLYEEVYVTPPAAALAVDKQVAQQLTELDLFIREHFGRPPRYTTDLYCCMMDIEVECAGSISRYWWLPVNHPLADLLHSYEVPNFGTIDTVCGACIIYPNQYMIEWLELVVVLFRERGVILEAPAGTMPPPPPPPTSSGHTSKKSD